MIQKLGLSALCSLPLSLSTAFAMDLRAEIPTPLPTLQNLLSEVGTTHATDGGHDFSGIQVVGVDQYRWVLPEENIAGEPNPHYRNLEDDLGGMNVDDYGQYLAQIQGDSPGAPVIATQLVPDPLAIGNNNLLEVTALNTGSGGYFEGFPAELVPYGLFARKIQFDLPDPSSLKPIWFSSPDLNVWYFLVHPQNIPLNVPSLVREEDSDIAI